MISINREHDYPLVLNVTTLKDIHLEGISFHRCYLNDLNFSGTILNKIDCRSAEMNRTKFKGASLYKCQLIMVVSKEACFDMCSFNETLLLYSNFEGSSFRGADLSKVVIEKTKFKNCDLRGANLDCEGLETCDFEGAIYDNSTVWHKSYNIAEQGAIKIE